MIEIKMFDHVLLKDGRRASIVEIFDDEYIVDVDLGGDYDTISISKSEIAKVLQ